MFFASQSVNFRLIKNPQISPAQFPKLSPKIYSCFHETQEFNNRTNPNYSPGSSPVVALQSDFVNMRCPLFTLSRCALSFVVIPPAFEWKGKVQCTSRIDLHNSIATVGCRTWKRQYWSNSRDKGLLFSSSPDCCNGNCCVSSQRRRGPVPCGWKSGSW